MRQNEDGTVHLAYYDAWTSMSFVWSGILGEPIEVCPGGYGEPPTDQIDIVVGYDTNLRDAMKIFEMLCRRFIAQYLLEIY